jgi:diguanylate cyclase (GGDEF)-like protein
MFLADGLEVGPGSDGVWRLVRNVKPNLSGLPIPSRRVCAPLAWLIHFKAPINSEEVELLKEETVRAQRFNHPVSLLMLDIDHFKHVNDTHGHKAGDVVLKGLSDLLMKQVRAVDRVCRYGGEEFTVILPETDAAVAMQIAERMRAEVERQPFDIGGGKTIGITVSIGVATYPQHLDSPEEVIKAADVALYAAKRAGRNRVSRNVTRLKCQDRIY